MSGNVLHAESQQYEMMLADFEGFDEEDVITSLSTKALNQQVLLSPKSSPTVTRVSLKSISI